MKSGLDTMPLFLLDDLLRANYLGEIYYIPWNTKGDIHITTTSKMESVQGHLSGGFTNGLGCNNSNRFTSINQTPLEFGVNHVFEHIVTFAIV